MSNPWLKHVGDFKKKHSNLSYKEILVEAKKTYKPVPKSGSKTAVKKTYAKSAKTSKVTPKKIVKKKIPKKGGNKHLDSLTDNAVKEYIEKNGQAQFDKEVDALPRFKYPKTETEYAKDLSKTEFVPVPVRRQRVRLDMPQWLADQSKDPKFLKEKANQDANEQDRLKKVKDVEAYEKLTPEQKTKRQQAVAKAWKEGLTNEAVNKVAKTAKGYIDTVAPLAGKVAEKVNPLAGKAFNVAKQGLDKFYNALNIPEDISNKAGADRIADRVRKATAGAGKKVVKKSKKNN